MFASRIRAQEAEDSWSIDVRDLSWLQDLGTRPREREHLHGEAELIASLSTSPVPRHPRPPGARCGARFFWAGRLRICSDS